MIILSNIMRNLKIYDEFDEITINFIRLDSIGHVLDPNRGLIYPMLKRGGYDEENGSRLRDDSLGQPWWPSVDEVEIQGLSQEDRELLDRYWISVEPLVGDKINFDLIETAKDLSLEYLDSGMRLIVYVFISEILVFTEIFSHDRESCEYPKYFKNRLDIITGSSSVSYVIRLDDKNFYYQSKTSKELASKVGEYFPDEKIELR
jgi:hypothetical protein